MLRHRSIALLLAALLAVALVGGPADASTPTKKKLPTLHILVTNDDGYAAEGIDAIVEASIALPKVEVSVVAPAEDKTGNGDTVSVGPVTATATPR